MASGDSSEGIVTFLLVCAVIYSIWAVWESAEGCFLADQFNYVTSRCALQHLQKPNCNSEQDILAVDEITDTSFNDEKHNRVEARSVIYQFKKRPLNGPVSAEVWLCNECPSEVSYRLEKQSGVPVSHLDA